MANDGWITPDWVFNWLDDEMDTRFGMRFDMDLAASVDNAKCSRFITKEQNSLFMPWHQISECGFCNPPYSKPNLPDFTRKAYLESNPANRCGYTYTSVLLVPFDITGWFREWVANKAEIWVPDERIPFIEPETGKPIGTPPKGSMLVINSPFITPGKWEVVHIPRIDDKELRRAA